MISSNSSRATLSKWMTVLHHASTSHVSSQVVRIPSFPPFTCFLTRHEAGIAAQCRGFLLSRACMRGWLAKSRLLPFASHRASQCGEPSSSDYETHGSTGATEKNMLAVVGMQEVGRRWVVRSLVRKAEISCGGFISTRKVATQQLIRISAGKAN